MTEIDYRKTYTAHVARCREQFAEQTAFEAAVGGEFRAVGQLERALLDSLGLSDGDLVVDIGCGSGRLAVQLGDLRRLRYIGTDVVHALLVQAITLARREDWRFVRTAGASIPCGDGAADFVCFFSVFTHLTHEDSFRYLREARRALRPGGRIVFSFLEFRIGPHWTVFENTVAQTGTGAHLNQFMDRDAIHAWARHLGLEVELIADGDKPHIPLGEPVRWDDGQEMRGLGNLGQSVAVLRKAGVGDRGGDRQEVSREC